METPQTVEALGYMLADLQAKCEQLEQENESLNEKLNWDSDWRDIKEIDNDHNLPIPRLELRAHVREGACRYKWCYSLIYKSLGGAVIDMPMGVTDVGSATGPRVESGVIGEPYRESGHIRSEMKHLNLPGFVIYGDLVMEISANNRDQIPWASQST